MKSSDLPPRSDSLRHVRAHLGNEYRERHKETFYHYDDERHDHYSSINMTNQNLECTRANDVVARSSLLERGQLGRAYYNKEATHTLIGCPIL